MVGLLLGDARIDASRTPALGTAAAAGHIAVAELLLGDGRLGVNPTAIDNAALAHAAAGGHEAVVERLLLEDRVYDSFRRRDAGISAAAASAAPGLAAAVVLLSASQTVRIPSPRRCCTLRCASPLMRSL